MINLSSQIRAAILNETSATSDIATYLGTKAVFTRRPIPADAPYPCVVIGSHLPSGESDYLGSLQRGSIYDIVVYAKNGSSEDYRKAESIAFAIQALFARPLLTIIEMPDGWHLSRAFSTGPSPAPTDDNETVARGISLNLTITEN